MSSARSPALRFAETASLRIAYEESGDPQGPPALLLHGWPDDARTWDGVRVDLDAAGYRVITPYLRGFGLTQARPGVRACGQLSVMARDVLALADALGIDRFFLAGHDWGARITYLASALYPSRIRGAAALAVGYGNAQGETALDLAQARNYWYQWYLATPMGAAALERDRTAFCRLLWDAWAPGWSTREVDFEATAPSFENADWLAVTLHSYRHRWGLEPGHSEHGELEQALTPLPRIEVPFLVLHGDADTCNAPSTSEWRAHWFTGPYQRQVLAGVGHFPQREAPQTVSARLLSWWSDVDAGPSN